MKADRTEHTGWARLCLLVGAVVAAFGLVLGTGVAGPEFSQTLSNFGLCLGAIAAAVSCLIRARSFTGRLRWGWGLVGLGVLSWGLGQGAWVYLESFQGDQAPFPSIADLGYVGMVLLTPVGLLVMPSRAQSLANRARIVLDGLMVAASLVLIAWIFVITPLIEAGQDSTLALTVSLAYPLGDVVIVTVVLYMLAQQRRHGRTFDQLALVGVGITAFAVSDIGYAYLSLIGEYNSGGVTDIGWFAGFSMILLAAFKPVPPPDEDDEERDGDNAQPVGIMLPYVAVLAALLTSVVWYARTGDNNVFVTYIRSILILLIVVRQLLTLRENRGLTRTLEARVAARTTELFASEQRFRALVQHSSDVVTVVSPDADVLYQSESAHRVFGYPARVLTGRRLTKLIDPESGLRLAQALRQVASRPYATTVLELTVRHRDGRVRQAEMTITNLLSDPNVAGLVLNTRDISERKELQDQLVHEAYHDALTQLANRALFRERLTGAIRRREDGGDVTVLFLDLDGFKEVNDSLGHLTGDQLLVQVADRLRASVRDGDLVARFGGDEFAVLIQSAPGTDDDEAGRVAQRIIDVLEEPFAIEARSIHVQASIGLAAAGLLAEAGLLGDAEADIAEQLMRNADLAMYKAKSAGGSCYASYDPEMLSELVARLELEADLRVALERGQLRLHYQPTIDVATNEVIGFEALARWQHPERGLIPPAEFIPIAEATGLIVPLGRWVLREACRQAVEWSAAGEGRPIKMAVNVSVRQFDRTDLVEVVAGILAETGMPANQLCLEMTESVLMTDTDDNLEQLLRLKALGVTLAIDDFGTGYSSLAYLRRFPVDTLKIDRSFVERLGTLTDDTALADTIVQLGKSLGMATVAEGIEEFVQLEALREMGCHFAQGYYFSRPVSADQAGLLLTATATAPAR
ncbi:bifunctional diguanylate cyclase/phosphodiesterase [Actinoplanes sp. NPDC051861]|uniref:putative bifunctional diguanylate cyclase/phosphodiesterase n=1 Tax=Actinoplanes sp. NPDC051861 TaxID=3155170 RepID=UPI00342D1E1F